MNSRVKMSHNHGEDIGKILKQQRISLSLTLRELAAKSGVSSSHLGRIEQGQRFPSAHILLKIAGPLNFNENELFMLAGYLSRRIPDDDGDDVNSYPAGKLDSSVAMMLSRHPVSVQRAALGVLSIMKYISNVNKHEVSEAD
jgi:transcriptional regulator with XRE-family HTH domain